MTKTKNGGFTLVELMIVVIVVGVLAAVAIPMYQIVPERSKALEATSALGMVRNAMRAHFNAHGTYAHASFVDGALVTTGGVLSIKPGDLEGRWFSEECYTFDGAATATTYTLKCDGSLSTADNASEVETIIVTIDQDGEIVTDLF
ncbi:MAG: prepilin-type N-terminal cleavage/methylation domain-containing protein [Candidatus Eisenbacteria bacterium]|nr:prepilin-type N-terminal cleavage/methylation domain-containing protein [Candidatus Eisenbacteria bacterium]